MIDYHNLETKKVFSVLKTREHGLLFEEAEKKLARNGFNELPREKPLKKYKIFFSQFNNPLALILIAAGVFSLFLHEVFDATVIFGAVLINSVIGFFAENKANNAILQLRQFLEHKAIVLRDKKEHEINSREIVKGDVVVVKSGDRIPADARIFECNELEVDEAALTGESAGIKKNTEIVPKGASLGDRTNMLYAGTIATHGTARAVVVSVGENTELGEIARLVKETEEESTPLQKRLLDFSKFLGFVFVAICILIVVVGVFKGPDFAVADPDKNKFLQMIELAVAVGVASIPEGLTVAVTFILAFGMRRILKKQALTRKLVATETLGSTTVICTDKTGTLTEGKMSVAHIIIGEREFEFSDMGSRQEGKEAKVVSLALQAGLMCNDAVIENPEDELKTWQIIGSATEKALMLAAVHSGLNKEKLLAKEPQIANQPFDSEKKFMLSLHKRDESFVLYEKGAPEKLLKKSSRFYHQNKVAKLDDGERKKLNRVYEKLTARGLRVIALAVRDIKNQEYLFTQEGTPNWELIDQDLTFVGFIALKDPLREEARETITVCKQAGIKPILITGDHKLTARAIAEEVGMKTDDKCIMLGEELNSINDEELDKVVKKINIYARVSPHHKLRIVKSLQRQGEVVAMTGDGVNDSPALKAADIGVSLGTGTDIAKENSDIILLDDNFKTIVSAVEQGRVIFKNIRKVITFLIADSFSEMILIVGSIIFNLPLAILPLQILWINIVNDSFPHFSLAFEKGGSDVMKEKPIKKNEAIMTSEMKMIVFGAGIVRDLILFALFYFLLKAHFEVDYIRTLMFVSLGLKSLASIFSIRRFRLSLWQYNPFSNPQLLFGVGISLALLVLGVYLAPLQKVLSTVSLDAFGWLMAATMALFSIVAIEVTKLSYIRKDTN